MNLKQLKDVVRLFEESTLTMLEVREGEEVIRLRRGGEDKVVYAPVPAAPVSHAAASAALSPVEDQGPDFNRIVEVKSPVVGVYYEAPEPGGKPFVQVGDRVQKGDVLCLVEVMKQVTEIVAPQDGQVADILLQNGSVVEFGQTLIKLC